MMLDTLGLSAQSIADRSGRHYPHDPADLLRCLRYCEGHISTADLRERLAGKSREWDRLLVAWDDLAALLHHEMETRTDDTAPRTYVEMKRLVANGRPCETCDATGRGDECPKCKGTGRRCGGQCRADDCYRGAAPCPDCWGRGYVGGDR